MFSVCYSHCYCYRLSYKQNYTYITLVPYCFWYIFINIYWVKVAFEGIFAIKIWPSYYNLHLWRSKKKRCSTNVTGKYIYDVIACFCYCVYIVFFMVQRWLWSTTFIILSVLRLHIRQSIHQRIAIIDGKVDTQWIMFWFAFCFLKARRCPCTWLTIFLLFFINEPCLYIYGSVFFLGIIWLIYWYTIFFYIYIYI